MSAACAMKRVVPLRSWGASRFCVGSARGAGWVEVEAAEMEVDGIAEALAVAKAPRCVLQPLDLRVDAFGAGVGDALDHGGDDPVQVRLDHPRHLLDRLQA